VGIIHHRDHPVTELVIMGITDGQNFINGGMVPPHTENAVKNHHHPFYIRSHLSEASFQVCHIIVFENPLVLPWDIADAHSPDNAVVVELVPDPMGFFVGNGQGKATIGGIGGIENFGRGFPYKTCDAFFQVSMLDKGSINESDSSRAHTEFVGGFICRINQFGTGLVPL
jgi:hypothetical protein